MCSIAEHMLVSSNILRASKTVLIPQAGRHLRAKVQVEWVSEGIHLCQEC